MSDVSCRRQEFLLRSQDWCYINQKNTFLGDSDGEVIAVNSRILLTLSPSLLDTFLFPKEKSVDLKVLKKDRTG